MRGKTKPVRERGSFGKVVGGLIAAGFIIWIASQVHSANHSGTEGQAVATQPVQAEAESASPSAGNPPPSATPIPDDEQQFISIVQDASTAFDAGANDMAKGATRPARGVAICRAMMGTEASNWVGTIDTLSSNSDGKGVLTLRLSPHLTVGTTNNDLSDSIGMKTLIPPGSPIFTTASGMSVGSKVVFSGTFNRADTDCFQEMSLTQEGSMQDPDFLMAFTALAPAP